jgi:hypothetical protein
MSAALRSIPAFFRASLFSFPGGIKRAASRASMALASKSSSASGSVRFNDPRPYNHAISISRHAIIRGKERLSDTRLLF